MRIRVQLDDLQHCGKWCWTVLDCDDLNAPGVVVEAPSWYACILSNPMQTSLHNPSTRYEQNIRLKRRRTTIHRCLNKYTDAKQLPQHPTSDTSGYGYIVPGLILRT